MQIVLPGFELVCASSFPLISLYAPLQSIFIRDDFPTLLLPIKANSGSLSVGLPESVTELAENNAVSIFIGYKFAPNLTKNPNIFFANFVNCLHFNEFSK